MCTAATYKTKCFYFGRNLDYERGFGEQVVITPRLFPLPMRHLPDLTRHYAMIGMASVQDGYPLYYDAVNEKGLCMAGLNFVRSAVYGPCAPGKASVAQFELIPWLLGRCATAAEARDLLAESRITDDAFLPGLPPARLHWLLADREQCFAVEQTAEGLRVYEDPAGVLTNEPPFPMQLFRLNDYAQLSPQPPENHFSPALPLGLSFYVFTAIGYCADVAAGKVESEKNPIRFAVFLAFFGHGPSGPIVRYGQQAPQLDPGSETRRVSADRFCYGIKRLVLGLAKKAIIADQLALIYAKVASVPAATLPTPILVLGYTAYMMQLYFDFSGYSDMAIGIGEFFGITLPENFEYPYLACSVGEYWRRWHISLSSWFRDYVYIPLGGSRCRLRRTCLNLLIVFALTGLWHGAAWQYVVFGLLHGMILCMERLGLRRALEQLPRLFRHLYTVVLLWLTLVIFGAPGLSEGLAVLKGIFTWQSGAKGYTLAAFADTKLLLILAASFLLCGPVQALCPKLKAALYAKKAPSPAGMAGLLVLLFLGLMRVTAGTYSAFIYFQF